MARTADDVLEHYGVKGMKWGVRKDRQSVSDRVAAYKKKRSAPTKVTVSKGGGKTRVSATGGKNQKTTADAQRTAVIKQKAKASSTDVLSNKELEAAIKRMDLERRFNQLSPKQESAGKQIANIILSQIGMKEASAIGAGVTAATGNPVAGTATTVALAVAGKKQPEGKKKKK